MVVNDVVSGLKEIGFSEYEAKAYIAFLKSNPVTGYEVARAAGIPTSKIYQVIDKLVKRGLLQPYEENGKKFYIPLEAGEFIESHKRQINTTLSSLKDDLASLKSGNDVSIVWNLRDYANLIEKGERLMEDAKETLLVSIWKEDFSILYPFLEQAAARKVKVAVVHFGEPTHVVGTLFCHPISDTLYSEKGGRGVVIVSDSRAALMGTVLKEDRVEGAWSSNKGFVALAEDYIKHDIYMMKIVKRFDRELLERFGDKYHLLRDIFSDKEV